MVPKAVKLFGRPFGTKRGVNQGDTVSQTIFNIVVDTVVKAVLLEFCRPQDAHHGLCWEAGGHSIILYADYGCIVGSNHIWVQKTITAVVRMFKRVGLLSNFGKTKVMVCTPGFIWGQQGIDTYKWRVTGEEATFWERNKTKVSCKDCGRAMAESPLCHHMERTHGIVLPHTWG